MANEAWTEWGVRRTWGAVGTVAEFGRDWRTAEKCAREWPGEIVSRRVVATEWVGHRRMVQVIRSDDDA